MTAIRFVAIQAQAVLRWLKEGRIIYTDLDACLFVLPDTRDVCRTSIPVWADSLFGPEEGPAAVNILLRALDRAEAENRVSWRYVNGSVVHSIDRAGAAHGLINILDLGTRAMRDKDRLKPSVFRTLYGEYSPRVPMTSKNMEAALRTGTPGLCLIH